MSSTDVIGLAGVGAQLIVAIVAIVAVLASLHANKEQITASEKQLTEQIAESWRLATEERQYQSRPILVPKKPLIQTSPTYYNMGTKQTEGESLYSSDHTINWAYAMPSASLSRIWEMARRLIFMRSSMAREIPLMISLSRGIKALSRLKVH